MKRRLIPIAFLGAALFASGPASALCVKAAEANLRQGPGTQHAISWEVFKYMPLRSIGEKSGWYHVEDLDGDRHWIFGRLVDHDMRCAVVKANKANVRSGPGTQHANTPLGLVDRYYAFKVIGTQGDWVRVEDEVKNQGWVHRNLLWMQ